jgi:DNA-binding response OmpR family regulator
MARILVVDDENNIRMMVRLALQHVGYTVDTAADGPDGLEKFGNGSGYDLVLLDQRMPGMEGLEVLREMRRRDPQAHVVMATAFGTIDLAVEAMKSGATDFLRKPFTAEVLRGAVQSTLAEPRPTATSAGITFGSTTINGYRVEFQMGTGQKTGSEFRQKFTVRSPTGQVENCEIILPGYVMELVRAHTDMEQMPGGDRFWQALCEEGLANYLWQQAEFPSGDTLRIEDFSTGLRRFVDAVLAA